MASFGASFGHLVREKRGIERLSQEELAAQAEVTKARISDLENGKINNPHAKTVDALCVALNISREERASCHNQTGTTLPPLLLENLALRFGHGNPKALEGDLVAFLNEQAVEFAAMQKRLTAMDTAGSAVAKLVIDASGALEVGDFRGADAKLAEAEGVQLTSATLPALEGLHRLRFERGNAALLAGDVGAAAGHWETAVKYFHFFDAEVEADRRHECSVLLREYAYRYKNAAALYAAEAALRKNLELWTNDARLADWCKAMIALGGVYWRMSQFDDPAKFDRNLMAAKVAYVAVREGTSATSQPYYYAISGGNLANIYSDTDYSNSVDEYASNLKVALELLLSAVLAIERDALPTD